MHRRPNCPHLPTPEAQMSHRCLTGLKGAEPARFYLAALTYGHYLWQHGHSGRAILALTRALYADVPATDPILQQWPLPYAALQWIIANHRGTDFPGNPRISFQHQATRLRGERQCLRRARAWAVWALICKTRPELEADRTQAIVEPTLQDLATLLKTHGHTCEAAQWHSVHRGIRVTESGNTD
jgi:hypothetical protein